MMKIMAVVMVLAILLTLVVTTIGASTGAGVLDEVPPASKRDHLRLKSELMQVELNMQVGHDVTMSPEEWVVNDRLMAMKRKEIDKGIKKGLFRPSSSFHDNKCYIDKSEIFKFIQQMPKGSVLHTHDLTNGYPAWVVKHATYRPLAKMCREANGNIVLAYFDKVPPPDTKCEWTSVQAERRASGNAHDFDDMLIKNISMVGEETLAQFPPLPRKVIKLPTVGQCINLLMCTPIMRDYLYQSLVDCYNDNTQYMELRILEKVFDLDESPSDNFDYTIKVYQEVLESFLKEHPDFSGMKIIITSSKRKPMDTVNHIFKDLQNTIRLMKEYPGFVVGYDLVGQEDTSYTIEHYLDALLYPSQHDPPIEVPYFFHAGAIDWQQTKIDYNLFDAILLNATRIGHGFALIKHPVLAQIVRDKGIAIEVNPVSNQEFGLIMDMRNHPMIHMLAEDYPIVISNDDRFLWNAAPASHDFYVAFMAMSGRDTGLPFLKKLALNSIKYSMMSESEKAKAMSLWQEKWDAFIHAMAEGP